MRGVAPIVAYLIVIAISMAVLVIFTAWVKGWLVFSRPSMPTALRADRLSNESIVVVNLGFEPEEIAYGICANGSRTGVTMMDLAVSNTTVKDCDIEKCILVPNHPTQITSKSGCTLVGIVTKSGKSVIIS